MGRSIVIAFDCLPAHWLGCYGNFDIESPAFDWLATQSIVFDRHVTNCPGRLQAMEPLLTGRYALSRSSIPNPPITDPDRIGANLAKAESGDVWLWLDSSIDISDNETDDADDVDQYQDHVDRCDEMLVESLEQIEAAGWLDALLVVTAVRGLCGRKSTLEEGHGFTNLRLPLIVRHPEIAGFRLQPITQPIDLVPTLSEYSGTATSKTDVDGISLLPLITGEADRIRDHGFFRNNTHAGVIVDDFILIRAEDDCPPAQLFLQPDDRWMIHNVAAEYPLIVDELIATLDEWLS